MRSVRPLPNRQALQAIFARASARSAERRAFVRTLREILDHRLTLEPMLLLKQDRRQSPREESPADPDWVGVGD